MKRLQRQLVLLTAVLLTLAAIFVSVRADQNFEGSLPAQALAVEREISRSVTDVIQKALLHGIPFDELVDAGRFLDTVKRDNPRLEYLIVTDAGGVARYSTHLGNLDNNVAFLNAIATRRHEATARIDRYFNSSTPIRHGDLVVGYLNLGHRANIVAQLLLDIAADIVAVLVVAGLVAFELVRLLMAASFSSPLMAVRQFLAGVAAGDFRRYLPRDVFAGIGRLERRLNATVSELNSNARRLEKAGAPLPQRLSFDIRNDRTILRINAVEAIRWPFFLLIFAESLSLAFFPNFVSQFYDPSYGLSRHIVIGIPITVFMLVWAIAMPFAGTWCDRVGYRKAFGVGAATTTAGLILTAYSTSLLDLVIWRSLTAVGYGIVYVTTQAYITTYVAPAERTRGQAAFLASFFAGSLSGAAIGGILVDRLGFQMTFLFSAGLSAMTAIYVARFLGNEVVQAASPKKRLTLSDFKLLLHHKQFAAITFLSAIPAKVALAGFLYYSVPLYLKGLGYNQSVTGRVMMAYGLAIILASPVVAQLADRSKDRSRFLIIGGLIAAIAMAIPLFVEDMTGAALAVIGLGLGHAIGVSPQMTLIIDRCGETVKEVGQATSVGIFRLVERIGTITGPILLGVMIALTDFMGAFAILAIFTFATTASFTLLLLWFDRGAGRAPAV
ncbi:MAG: MFS transporter [Xanthobacteraceae bacterium]|nr:MFS transporter [Xanthobacteraceae bacterium]